MIKNQLRLFIVTILTLNEYFNWDSNKIIKSRQNTNLPAYIAATVNPVQKPIGLLVQLSNLAN